MFGGTLILHTLKHFGSRRNFQWRNLLVVVARRAESKNWMFSQWEHRLNSYSINESFFIEIPKHLE